MLMLVTPQTCEAGGGSCITQIEGYFVLSAVCFVIGLIWLRIKSARLRQLGEANEQAWKYKTVATS